MPTAVEQVSSKPLNGETTWSTVVKKTHSQLTCKGQWSTIYESSSFLVVSTNVCDSFFVAPGVSVAGWES